MSTRKQRRRKTWFIRCLLGLVLSGVAICLMVAVSQRRADRISRGFLDDDEATVLALADVVSANAIAGISADDFDTGSDRFNGEWALVTCQMTVLGLVQVVETFPHTADRYRPAVQGCVNALLEPSMRDFGTRAWGVDGLTDLSADHGHAYLGYTNLALSRARVLIDDPVLAQTNNRLTRAFTQRLANPIIQTYPGEAYPADMAAVLGSIGANAQVRHRRLDPAVTSWLANFADYAVDKQSGMLVQSVHPQTGEVFDGPRGSGTAIGAYFLGFVSPELSRQLSDDLRVKQGTHLLGFGAIREYPPGTSGFGDIDSGPVLFGVSISATGFGLSGLRSDELAFQRTYRTAHLFGLSYDHGETRPFLAGGGLGNAIMLAMLTAPRR